MRSTGRVAAARAIREWIEANDPTDQVSAVVRVYPRCKVEGHSTDHILIVRRPAIDAPPNQRDYIARNPLATVRVFDSSLKEGDWCALGEAAILEGRVLVAVPAV